MQLDVIVPTYNRAHLLKLTLQSLLAAEVPAGLSVQVTVVDNNSTDQTQQTVSAFQPLFAGKLNYLFEPKQGRSSALNAGIAATDGDLVGMVDDDEEIDISWYVCVYKAFCDEDIDFIGGPYVPRWGGQPPSWLPTNNSGVIGSIGGFPHPFVYGSNEAMLMGGNAILTRSILRKVGFYSTDLGGVSSGVLDRRHPKDIAYLFGIPRYLFGRALRAFLRMLRTTPIMHTDPAQRFSDELKVWDVAGFFYGKHFYKPAE